MHDRAHDERYVHDDVHGKQAFRLAVHRYENEDEHHHCYDNSGDEQ